MNTKVRAGLLLAVAFAFSLQSCEKLGEENETKISSYNDDESHSMGENCMACHLQGGEGEGWFNVGGTVYGESKTEVLPNATVKLYTEVNGGGTLKYTLEGDAKGNFYTTETVDFGTGLYASVEGNESAKNMITPITSGACNSCHSSVDNRIWTK